MLGRVFPVFFRPAGGRRTVKKMSEDKKKMKSIAKQRPPRGRDKDPEWANGLRRLYDSVVEEPLPDSFAKLLDQLDSSD